MSRRPRGARLSLGLGLIVGLSSCRTVPPASPSAPPMVAPAPVVEAPAPTPAPPPPPPARDPALEALTAADEALAAGDLGAAAQALDHYLTLAPQGSAAPRALFLLYVLCSRPPAQSNELYDPQAAREYLRRLREEFPQSPYRVSAQHVDELRQRAAEADGERRRRADLEAELARLRAQLEKLKALDLREPPP